MPAVGFGKSEIETNALGVPDVQVAIRLRWEPCINCLSDQLWLAGKVLFDFDFDEILVGMSTSQIICIIHYVDLPWFIRLGTMSSQAECG